MNNPNPVGAPEESIPSLVERFLADQKQRFKRGAGVPVEHYLAQQPRLLAEPEAVLDLLCHEMVLREGQGETPALQEYVGRFPQLSKQLDAMFEIEQALQLPHGDEKNATLVYREESDPLETVSPAMNADATSCPPDRFSSNTRSHGPAVPDIPGYEILEVLGQGGMGVVYKARNLALNRLVALKLIGMAGVGTPNLLSRFQREAEAVARLQHPNIVQIFEIGEHGGIPYLSLEFVAGQSLATALAGTPQSPHDSACLVGILAGAISDAHKKGIVHRDLKPANVLLDFGIENIEKQKPRIANAIPKIVDFGLAKHLDRTASANDPGQTKTGDVMGTPSYMAPEQAAGKTHQIGPAADIYALGAILYEMLTGRPPFKAATPMDTLIQVMTEEPLSPRRLQGKVPLDLETICLKCLDKDPRRRYPSAEHLAEDLRRQLAGEPIQARRTSALERALKWSRRRPVVAGLIGGIVLVTMVALGVVSWLWLDASAARSNERRQRQLAEEKEAKRVIALAKFHWLGKDLAKAREYLKECALEFRDPEWARLDRLCKMQLHCLHVKHYVRRLWWRQHDDQLIGATSDGEIILWNAQSGDIAKSFRWRDITELPAIAFSLDATADDLYFLAKKYTDLGRKWRFEALSFDLKTGVRGNTYQIHMPLEPIAIHAAGPRVVILDKPVNPIGAGRKWELLDMSTGKPLLTGQVKSNYPRFHFSDKGHRLMMIGSNPMRYADVWDIPTKQVVYQFETKRAIPPQAPSHYFFFNGERFTYHTGRATEAVAKKTVTTVENAPLLIMHDLPTNKEVMVIEQPGSMESMYALSPDATRIALTTDEHIVIVRDAQTGAEQLRLIGHADTIVALAFSRDGHRLATSSNDGTVRIWDVRPLE